MIKSIIVNDSQEKKVLSIKEHIAVISQSTEIEANAARYTFFPNASPKLNPRRSIAEDAKYKQ